MDLIDVHCHLDDPSFERDLEEVIQKAKSNGVKVFVLSAMLDLGLTRAIKIASDHACVELSVGAQPQSINENNWKAVLENMEEALKTGKFIAVGEVGLDRGRGGGDLTFQEKFFREAIRLAESKKLPLVVHSRGAGREAIRVLLDEKPNVNVDMHAYDGRVSTAKEASEKDGIFFSIPPSVARSDQKTRLVKALPITSILLESDAPALAPEPGERNTPSNLIVSVSSIAKIKNLTQEWLASTTSKNAQRFFGKSWGLE
ncbi:MAG: TatD family hydrolase, partial [Candidatus Marsarchaeota archaeon]